MKFPLAVKGWIVEKPGRRVGSLNGIVGAVGSAKMLAAVIAVWPKFNVTVAKPVQPASTGGATTALAEYAMSPAHYPSCLAPDMAEQGSLHCNKGEQQDLHQPPENWLPTARQGIVLQH